MSSEPLTYLQAYRLAIVLTDPERVKFLDDMGIEFGLDEEIISELGNLVPELDEQELRQLSDDQILSEREDSLNMMIKILHDNNIKDEFRNSCDQSDPRSKVLHLLDEWYSLDPKYVEEVLRTVFQASTQVTMTIEHGSFGEPGDQLKSVHIQTIFPEESITGTSVSDTSQVIAISNDITTPPKAEPKISTNESNQINTFSTPRPPSMQAQAPKDSTASKPKVSLFGRSKESSKSRRSSELDKFLPQIEQTVTSTYQNWQEQFGAVEDERGITGRLLTYAQASIIAKGLTERKIIDLREEYGTQRRERASINQQLKQEIGFYEIVLLQCLNNDVGLVNRIKSKKKLRKQITKTIKDLADQKIASFKEAET